MTKLTNIANQRAMLNAQCPKCGKVTRDEYHLDGDIGGSVSKLIPCQHCPNALHVSVNVSVTVDYAVPRVPTY